MTLRNQILDQIRRRRKVTTPAPQFVTRQTFDLNRLAPATDADYAALDQLLRESYSDRWIRLEEHELPPRDRALSPAKIAQIEASEARGLARYGAVAEQEQRIAATWAAAIEALPRSMRQLLASAAAAIDEARQQQAAALGRLGAPPSEDTALWVARRAQLTSSIDALDDLVIERTAEYRRLCQRAMEWLASILAEQADRAAQATQDTQARYDALLAEARAEIGRCQAAQRAIGAVASEARRPAAVESRFGPVVTVEPDRQAQRETQRAQKREISFVAGSGATL